MSNIKIDSNRIDIIGLGRANTELSFMLSSLGYSVYVHDKNTPKEETLDRLSDCCIKTAFGEHYLDNLDGDLIIRTPGMYFRHPALKGKNVDTEIGLFVKYCPCITIGITGSDGKTTTSSLIADMLKQSGHAVHLGGNIGLPMLCNIDKMKKTDYAVVELSSFQLADMKVSPNIAVVTNLSPNHLDVHGTMEEYQFCKANILRHQKETDTAVLGPKYFEQFVQGKLIYYRDNTLPFDKSCIHIPGEHNATNMLIAYTAVKPFIKDTDALKTAETFNGVTHRIEFVRELDGVRYYNDSIATTPTRTIAGIKSFDNPLILIAGGYDKKIPFEPMKEVLNTRLKSLVLVGDTTEKIASLVDSTPTYKEKNLASAILKAKELSKSGDVVLFSPACASFDQFPNFEKRGNYFKEQVMNL